MLCYKPTFQNDHCSIVTVTMQPTCSQSETKTIPDQQPHSTSTLMNVTVVHENSPS